MSYPLSFRKKIFNIQSSEGLSDFQISQRFAISTRTLSRWRIRLEPKKRRNKPPTKINTKHLLEDVAKYPDAYLYERAQRLGVSQSGIFYALRRLNIRYKKNAVSSES